MTKTEENILNAFRQYPGCRIEHRKDGYPMSIYVQKFKEGTPHDGAQDKVGYVRGHARVLKEMTEKGWLTETKESFRTWYDLTEIGKKALSGKASVTNP